MSYRAVSRCNFFCLKLLWLHLCFGLRFFGLARFLLRLFLHEQGGFLFLDTLVAFLVHFIVPVLDVSEFFGHVLMCEIEQKGCNGVTAVCAFEVGNQEIPADKCLLLCCEVVDDIPLLLV